MSSEEAAAKNVASNSDENMVIEVGGNVVANEDSDIISSPTIPTNLGGPPGKTQSTNSQSNHPNYSRPSARSSGATITSGKP